jgi:nucleotide-binding universal stress UspA family protein
MTRFRRILVPYDFSDAARAALGVASDLAAAHRGRLTVLHVVALTPLYPGPDTAAWAMPEAELMASERQHLEAEVARVTRRRGVRAACRVVLGVPYQRIIEAARDADVVVMGTAGRTGVARLVIGSVAERVVRHAPVPVLTVRPPVRRRAARRPAGRAAARRRA